MVGDQYFAIGAFEVSELCKVFVQREFGCFYSSKHSLTNLADGS